jgi:hypothetical protein
MQGAHCRQARMMNVWRTTDRCVALKNRSVALFAVASWYIDRKCAMATMRLAADVRYLKSRRQREIPR